MKRRALLATVPAITAGVAGCVGGALPTDGSDDTATDDDVSLPSTSMTVHHARCGDPDDDWAVLLATDTGVAVRGVSPAPNPCHGLIIDEETFEAGSMTLSLETTSTLEANEDCIECHGAIEYSLSVETEEPPSSGTITHPHGESHEMTVRDPTNPPKIDLIDATTVAVEPDESEDTAEIHRRGRTVWVTGQLIAPDPCHEAVVDASFDAAGDLTITVDVERSEGSESCAAVLSGLSYEVAVEFEDPYQPATITVKHVDGDIHTDQWGESSDA